MSITIPFKDKTQFIQSISQGQQGVVDKHSLLQPPDIQSPDLGGTKTNLLEFVAVKNFFADDDGNINSTALRELHVFYLMMGCPNIIQLLDVTTYTTRYDVIILRVMMPYHTSDLSAFISTIPFLERIKYSQDIIDQLLTGLYQLYYRGIIHGDIKPQNILVDYIYNKTTKKLESDPRIYISDFGSSIQLPCDVNYRNIDLDINIYTLPYRPPEIFGKHRNYTDKADIWAMGITLLEYFISRPITNPHLQSYIDYPGDIPRGIIYQILPNLRHPLSPTDEHLEQLKNLQIHDGIDVETLLQSDLSSFHYSLISNDIIGLLSNMLMINPDDRAHITDLVENVAVCDVINTELPRGPIANDSEITPLIYYETVQIIINVSKTLLLNAVTCINGIDLLDRYLAHNVIDASKLILIAAACLLLKGKILEIKPPDADDIIYALNAQFTADDLGNAEIMILNGMNYVIGSCDVDELARQVRAITKERVYNVLTLMYEAINELGLYAGEVEYDEILQFLQIANENT